MEKYLNRVIILENQLFILLIFILSGYVIGILFDLFRITRKLFKLPNFVTYIEDVLFWILTGIILIFVICFSSEFSFKVTI